MSDLGEKCEVSHPFDREEEVSLQQLFTAFCNHLTLGQWELTRVCLRGLFEKRDQLDKPLKEILRAIIDQPHRASYGSPSVPSPFHLSWLCLLEYQELFTSEEDQIPEPVVKKVEFRLLLYLACREGPQNVIQDIDDYHSQIVYRDPDLFASGVSDLPSSTLFFLKQLLWESPRFGQAVINELTSKGKAFLKNNLLLQQLYLSLIKEHLDVLDSVHAVENTEETTDGLIKRVQKFIYQMLSYMDPTSEMLELSEPLENLFKDLLNRTFLVGHHCLDKSTLYSCFIGRSTTYLIEKFCNVENQMRFCSQGHPELPFSVPSVKGFHEHACGLFPSSFVQVCYTQSFMKDRREAWKYLFFHALDGNHILENIVETALVFVRDEDYGRLTQLLSPAEFARLKPLILLLGWPYCYSCDNAKKLLEVLWDPAEEAVHPLLYQACQKLAYQVQLVQWCTEKAGPLLASSDSGSTRHQQASEMFQGLESHSVLHVLHKSISLARLPEKEVFELLRKRPVFSPFDATTGRELSVERNQDSSENTAESDDNVIETEEKVGDQAQDSAIHPEVERDIFLYHSYCALRNFMEAITFSATEPSFSEATVQIDRETAEEQSAATPDSTALNQQEDSAVEEYEDQIKSSSVYVTNKLECGKDHLSRVFPLTYRVEILENIFSLLFGTYEDLYEGASQQNESDGLETWDEETRSLSKSSHTGSWESLASSIDQSFDEHGQSSPLKDQEKSTGLNSPLTSTTSETQQRQREVSTIAGLDPSSRKQLFRTDRSESETQQRQREVPALAGLDPSSRKQLFRTVRSESDSVLFKKAQFFADEKSAAAAGTGDNKRTKQFDSESVTTSGGVSTSKGALRAVEYDDSEFKYGFVVDDALVPEVLRTLKECLMELNSAKFTEHKKDNLDAKKCPDCLRTSVPVSAIEQRTSRLGQFINEAQWRFQLVSWNDGPDRKSKKRTRKGLVTSERLLVEKEQDEASDDALTESKPGTSDDQGRRRKRKRRRLTSKSSASESANLLIKDDSVIARMLSSPETLIYMCMRKENYERAFQVIKMFNMAEKPSGQAAIFSEKYGKSVKQLERLQPKERRITRQGLSKSRPPLGALGAVAMAAASGVGTSLASNLIDDLLATPSLAAILSPSLTPEDLAGANTTMQKFLDPDLVPTMLCVDLACTASVTWPVCKALLDMAKSRLSEGTSSSRSKSTGSLQGVIPFLNQLEQLLALEQSPGTRPSGGGITLSVSPKANCMEILLAGTHPIRPKDMAAHKKLVTSQEQSFRLLEQALEEGDSIIRSVDQASNPVSGHRHLGRQASFNLMEKGLSVRVSMIELQTAFDCVASASHVTTGAGEGLGERLDYVQSLFKHVDSLATLLLFWKSRSAASQLPLDIDRNRPSALKVSNPFVVLNDGIEDALGRPMFEKNIPPKSLEAAAKKLHVDLSKVIVYNCCPAVPSLGGVTSRDVRWPSSTPMALNTGSRWTESVRDPNTVAQDLLSRMIQLLRDVAETHGGVVDTSSAANAIKTPEFQAIARGTAEFQNVDLNLLNSDASKVCFYINTLNLLIAHASLIQFAVDSECKTSEIELPVCRHASFTRLSDALSGTGGEVRGDEGTPLTALERIAFLKQHSYSIGQLGLVSAFDLQYVILHKSLVPPSTFGEAIIMCFPERLADDPKRKYRMTTPEKRVIFAICDGCVSSPLLQVFEADKLDVQLSTAVVSYINSRVSLSQQSGEVTLPELLHWYRKDFEEPLEEREETDVSLLLQMEPYLYPDTALKLQQMLPHIKEIAFTPFCWRFGYRFEPELLERSTSSSGLQRSSSVPDSLCLSMELSVLAHSRSSDTRGLFTLNETALEYLEEKSPLIAALVSLICPAPHRVEKTVDQDLQQSTEPNTGEASTPAPRDIPNETDEFPLKVALRKTAKYPALQRYILSKLYTLADMLTVAPVDSEERGGSYGSYDIIKLDSKLQIVQGEKRAPEISLFSVALAPEGSRSLQNAVLRASDFYLREGYFEELFELINSSNLRGDGVAGPSIDFLLSAAVLSKGGEWSEFRQKVKSLCNDLGISEFVFCHAIHKRPWTLLSQIKDHELLARLVLGQLKERRASDCIDLIDMCLSRPLTNVDLRRQLEKSREEISLYRKISRCAKSPQLQAADTEEKRQSLSILKQWQGVAAASEEEPRKVLEFLLSVQQFELAAEWAELHSSTTQFHVTIKENHLKYLLENSPEDHVKAYRILETLQDQDMTLAVCESLLSQDLHVGQTLFIIQFMLTNLPSLISPMRIEKLLCTKMGAKGLLCLPDSARPNYEHLVSRPPLLLEQLLMNMKVEWAAKVFQRIQVDLSCMEDVESIGEHGCTVKAFDSLLAKYAAKALEFQVIQMEPSQTRELCSSIMQSLMQTPSSSPTFSTTMGGRVTPIQSSGRHAPMTSTPSKERGDRESVTGSLDRKSLRSAQAATLSPERKLQRKSQTIPPRFSDLGRKISVEESWKKATALQGGQQVYIPPSVPPKKEAWMPDRQALSCVVCGEPFSMFDRRHHCRRCGRVVCGTCSPHNHVVAGYGKNPVRVCATCHEYFYSERWRQVREDFSAPFRSTPVSLEKGRNAQGAAENPEASVSSISAGSYMDSSQPTDWLAEDINARCLWKLSLDKENNDLVRDEFFYEQAPSASLCVSILDLHSDVKACGKLILDLCNSLSQKLVPVSPGMRNEEVDHNLVISMIRYLLFNAKLKMMKAGETQGVELCDTYLGHVDLMKFLVESNCGDIPSLRDLMHPDSARRLRDRFIESERLSLAMEVSTKCGLDPSGVWSAAGFAHLQAGDFSTAREKFARCMKSEMVGKQHQQHNSQYLDKIIGILQSSPFLAYKQTTEDLMSPLRGLLENRRNFQTGSSYLDPSRFDECLYYLQTYGSPSELVAFYVRHKHIRLACRYILDKQISVDVFIENLMMRLVLKGNFALLKEQMEAADPTLQAWIPYLTAACKFLLRRSFHHQLYEVQVYMRDFFRAAQTCIRFYEGVAGGPVTSYEDLFSRLHHLDKAKQHIEEVIAEKRSPKGTVSTVCAYLRQRSVTGAKGASDEPCPPVMSLADLDIYLNTINLQVEVTNFMHRSAVEGGGVSLLRAGGEGRLPTLFGNGHVRAEMVVQVLLAGPTIQDGFSLASRIIQDYNLPAARVYVDAGRSLARQYKYSHIEQLLRCSAETGQVTVRCHDDIILACVSIVSADQSQAKHLEALIKLLKSDVNKINAFLMCGKLKSAYLIAVKGDRVDVIQEIAEVAMKTGQSKMVEICSKFLSQHQKRQEAQERRVSQRKQASNPNR